MTHYCKNGDEIKVGGVYEYHLNDKKFIHAVERINGGKTYGYEKGWSNNVYLLSKEITRELPRDSDGYYLWDGGECPVPSDWVVQCCEGSRKYPVLAAKHYYWKKVTRFRVVSTGVQDSEASINNEQARKTFNWNETVEEVPYTGEGLEFPTYTDCGEEPPKRTAELFLHQAASLMAERGKEYDKTSGERSMGQSVNAFNAITGKDLTEAEGWLLMSLVKRVRQYSTPAYHKDSAEDAVAYAALEAEALESAAAKCNYPSCNCPYDMGADNKCLRGLNTDHLRKGVR